MASTREPTTTATTEPRRSVAIDYLDGMTPEERAMLDALDAPGRAWVEGVLRDISPDEDALFAALAEADARDDDPAPK